MTITNTGHLLAALATGATLDYLYFWGHTPAQAGIVDKSCMSQWFPSPFTVDEVLYPTAEHYMMAHKALLFGDTAIARRVVTAASPAAVKQLGREVAGFDTARWEAARETIVFAGNLAKFGQDAALKAFLLATSESVIVEASPLDRIWGVGLAASDERIKAPTQWEGLNLLGFQLMAVRGALRAGAGQ